MQKLIFTKHALERMKLRDIEHGEIVSVLNKPRLTKPSEDQPDAIVSTRTLSGRDIHVVTKYLSDQKKTLVISTWVRGEEDPLPLHIQLLLFPFKVLFKLLWWLVRLPFRK